MSQTPLPSINAANTNGAELASFLNQMWAALITGWSGPTRPDWAVNGTMYKNTTLNALVHCGAASNGSQDVPLFTLAIGGENNTIMYDANHIPQPVSLAVFLAALATFTNASAPSTNGIKGLVPAPLVSQIGYVLKTGGWSQPDSARFPTKTVSADTTLVVGDAGKTVFIAAANKTIELPDATLLQDGDFIAFEGKIAGAPRTSIVPKSGVSPAQTIDGASSKTAFAFNTFRLVVSSGNWVTVGEQTGLKRDINFITGAYTLAATDANRPLHFNTTSPTNIAVTVPANGTVPIDVGSQMDLLRAGTGEVTFSPESGVVIVSEGSYTKLTAQGSAGTILKVATNTWFLTGALKA